ncbi:hypothetical protein I7I50_04422 [Histoplasma capsulatum G186AR]|nr:hypothetical protein I7I52_05330 [Histoplasma capsulatum]QSS75318.1 hypothetical protein I7I50_04422 [Histoplasma capsulatum G186AR]
MDLHVIQRFPRESPAHGLQDEQLQIDRERFEAAGWAPGHRLL